MYRMLKPSVKVMSIKLKFVVCQKLLINALKTLLTVGVVCILLFITVLVGKNILLESPAIDFPILAR
jgi:type III secretory pathway component EscU